MKKEAFKNAAKSLKKLEYQFRKQQELMDTSLFIKIRNKLLKTKEYDTYKSVIKFDDKIKATPFNLFKYHDLNVCAMKLINKIVKFTFKEGWRSFLTIYKNYYIFLAYKIKHNKFEI
ncbi:hypothetical protein TUBRATIS_24460 [Tubulinosema ratisbonensis]|uniref:Uncharacterized protein n=1 Tax=Tubulinosema ratisbonensis TaxID=291195 RepID=A0A437AIZ1_9MICR|nr:hypothetical protein TUBRATIS_24460 [Tubulinosema ratisbonensis]